MKKMLIIVIIAILAIFWFIGKSKKQVQVKQTEVLTTNVKQIEGSNPVDIYLSLEKKGFKISKQLSKNDKFWYCDNSENGFDYNVTIYSTNVSNIERIKISASINGSQRFAEIEETKPFLTFVATFPYKGSNSEKIKKWIDDNFNNDGANIIIGDSKFSIFAKTKFSRLIVIEKAQ